MNVINPPSILSSSLVAWMVVILLGACQGDSTEGAGYASAPVREFPVIAVRTMDVVSENIYPAAVEGIENIAIRAKVDGYIEQIFVDEGQFVQKGQPLFRLETQALSQSAKAAQSTIRVAEAGVNLAEVEVERLRPLVEKGIVSDVELKTAKANLASAESRLAEAESQYQGVRENIAYTHINSPVTGVVGRLPYRRGTLVGRSEVEPLTTVSNINQVYVYFAMNEKDFLDFMNNVEGKSLQEKVQSMPPVEFIMANGKRFEHPGKIETVSGQIDPRTGTINFRATFPNSDFILRSGGSGSIAVPTFYEDALVVPAQSTFERQGHKFVYRLNSGDSLSSQLIDFYAVVDNKVLVSGGIQEGDKILAEGVGNVRGGMVIRPEEKDFDTYIDNIQPVFR